MQNIIKTVPDISVQKQTKKDPYLRPLLLLFWRDLLQLPLLFLLLLFAPEPLLLLMLLLFWGDLLRLSLLLLLLLIYLNSQKWNDTIQYSKYVQAQPGCNYQCQVLLLQVSIKLSSWDSAVPIYISSPEPNDVKPLEFICHGDVRVLISIQRPKFGLSRTLR